MGVTCEILVYKPNNQEYHISGETVKGKIKYVIDKSEDYRNITLSLIGKGIVEWTEKTDKDNSTHIGEEKYVEVYQNLLEKNGASTVLVEEGTYMYDFDFILPENIPSSFEDDIAEIKYKLKLEFKKDAFFSMNSKFHTIIPIHSSFRSTCEPVICGLDKEITKLFSSKKHVINLKAEVEKPLVSPGEPFNVKMTVNNASNVDITAIKVELIRRTNYEAEDDFEEDVKVIKESTVQTEKVDANTTVELPMIVPTLSKLRSVLYSNILKREYILRLTVRLPIPHRNKSVDVPVVIGDRYIDGEEYYELAEEDAPPTYWEVMVEDMAKEVKE